MDELEINMIDGVYKNAKEFLEDILKRINTEPDLIAEILNNETKFCRVNLDNISPSEYIEQCGNDKFSIEENINNIINLRNKNVEEVCFFRELGSLSDSICDAIRNKIDAIYDTDLRFDIEDILEDAVSIIDENPPNYITHAILFSEDGDELAYLTEEEPCEIDFTQHKEKIYLKCGYDYISDEGISYFYNQLELPDSNKILLEDEYLGLENMGTLLSNPDKEIKEVLNKLYNEKVDEAVNLIEYSLDIPDIGYSETYNEVCEDGDDYYKDLFLGDKRVVYELPKDELEEIVNNEDWVVCFDTELVR